MPDLLRSAVDRARLYKIVTLVDVDMQNPSGSTGSGSDQSPTDDSEGLRDFSARTVEMRRVTGYRIASEKLAGYL
jgi:hypothetical protein